MLWRMSVPENDVDGPQGGQDATEQETVASSDMEASVAPGASSSAARGTAHAMGALLKRKLTSGTLRALAMLFFLLIVTKRAWVSDDAFISMRYVENFISGFGLTYNVGERVQGYTNPLWVLLLSAVRQVIDEPYVACVVLSIVTAFASAWVFGYRLLTNAAVAAFGIATLTFTQAFVDFSTSGLENPLGHLLLVSFLAIYFREQWTSRQVQLMWLLAGLMLVHRLDAILLIAPALLHLTLSQGIRQSLRPALIGLSPFIAWELFATLYYGLPVPNTAIAKLNVDIPRRELVGQGFVYLFASLEQDPLTILLIVAGLYFGFGSKQWTMRAAALGVVLNLAYVVWVAGDFMLGRFLSVALFSAVCIIAVAMSQAYSRVSVITAAALVAFVAVLSPHNPLTENPGPPGIPPSGVANERDFYRGQTGLLKNLRTFTYQKHSWYQTGVQMAKANKKADTHCNAGLAGMGAGPTVHMVDIAGLTDAFLARFTFEYKDNWRTAHHGRDLPQGYLETLRTGENHIKDPKLHEFYDKVKLVISGPIFDWTRLRTALALDLGEYDYLLAKDESDLAPALKK